MARVLHLTPQTVPMYACSRISSTNSIISCVDNQHSSTVAQHHVMCISVTASYHDAMCISIMPCAYDITVAGISATAHLGQNTETHIVRTCLHHYERKTKQHTAFTRESARHDKRTAGPHTPVGITPSASKVRQRGRDQKLISADVEPPGATAQLFE